MPSTTPAKSAGGRQLSLAWRLTVAYAGSSCLLVLAAAALMYYQLVASLQHETGSYLNEEVREVRSDLRQPLATAVMIRHEIESDSPSEGDAFPTYLRILDAGGGTMGETDNMSDLLPARLFPSVKADDVSQSSWQTDRSVAGERHRFQIGSAAIGGGGGSHYIMQIALDLVEEDKLLGQYRARMWAIMAPALLAAALIGYALAHSGLRPLRKVMRSVRRVQTTTLDQRIDPSGFPGELAKLAGSFNDMLQRIEDAFSRLSRFSADIAHELRTPLGCLRGELEVALGKARTTEEYREVLGSCLEECVRLGHLIDRLLFLARAEREEAMLRLETVDLDRELQKVREFYEAGAAENGITLSVEAEAGLQARLDRTLLQSALGNLLENAITHTPRGGCVRLTGANGDGTVRLEVIDNGSGIAADHLPFVLDRFYRADGARGRQGGHVGLGLAIVKSIATLHGGEVRIESEVGRGTRVTLLFPAALDAGGADSRN
jgi:two-component system, OmpR family, heavy metal sensor histidine kinase CusS